MFEVQIDNHNYGKVDSLQVAIDFCLYRLGVAKKNGVYISATIKHYEDCCNDRKKVETLWNCTTDDVDNWF